MNVLYWILINFDEYISQLLIMNVEMKLVFKVCLLIVSLPLLTSCSSNQKELVPVVLKADSIDQILPLEDSLVMPVLYQRIPNLNTVPIATSKEKFIAVVLPAILVAKYNLNKEQQSIRSLLLKKTWNANDSIFYKTQLKRFKAKDIQDLFVRMATHPNSIILAQAAVESGWGSSRFCQEANNLFGIWSYSTDEPRIPAKGSNVFLRKYSDISKSIEDYFVTIGRAGAYHSFRTIRMKSENISQLLPHLKKYSERGLEYTKQLQKIIDQNDFRKYDNYAIDPNYLVAQ
ncbi:MAG: glucosaminidase domain-containing protein [Bacteroidota bacterium]